MMRVRPQTLGLPPQWPLVIAISMAAVLVASVWAVRLPIFKPPDERAHADYAFVLYDVGRPFRVERAARTFEPVSEQVRYLDERVGYRPLRYNAYRRVVPGYGSAAYRHDLDRHAPREARVDTAPGAPLPYASFAYPALYYVLVAAVMAVGHALTGSLWWSFMLARFWNAALLFATLPLAYGVLRESGARPRTALLATAAIGFFPLVSWVGAYVQPDNLSFLLVTAAVFLALRLRTHPERSVWPLAMILGAMFFVKEHYAVGAGAAAWLLTATRTTTMRGRWRDVAIVTGVCALAFLSSLHATPAGHVGSVQAMLTQSTGRNRLDLALSGFADEFAGGSGFKDYWLYDVRNLRVFGIGVSDVFVPAATIVSLVLLALCGVAVVKLDARLVGVARRRSLRSALRLLGCGVALNVYVAVTAIVLYAYVLSNGWLWLEGRYWLPVIVPLTVALVVTLPTMVRPGRRAALAQRVAAGMLVVSIVTAPLMYFAMERDYYLAPQGHNRVDRMALVDVVAAAGRRYRSVDEIRLSPADTLRLSGYAVDLVSGEAATRVEVRVDERYFATLRETLDTPALAAVYNDGALGHAGFRVDVPMRGLAAGRHRIALYVVSADGSKLEFGNDVAFTLRGPARS